MNDQPPVSKQDIVDHARGDPKSEATRVEQSRAIAEVQGAIVVARQNPRNVASAHHQVLESCKMQGVAERAFFRFQRAGSQVTGESIHLAREMARCWGNIDYGIKELDRDDRHGRSEMLAFAWDLETNTRAETTFIVPHMRDKRGGPVRLTDMRDIYENNANMGARRVRECIFSVLPPWLIEDAREQCHRTLHEGGGEPLDKRRSKCAQAFDELNITPEQIQAKIGRPVEKLTEADLATLGVVLRSIRRGEVNVEDEFPPLAAPGITQSLKAAAQEGAQGQEETAPTEPEGDAAPAEAESQGGDQAGSGPTYWFIGMDGEEIPFEKPDDFVFHVIQTVEQAGQDPAVADGIKEGLRESNAAAIAHLPDYLREQLDDALRTTTSDASSEGENLNTAGEEEGETSATHNQLLARVMSAQTVAELDRRVKMNKEAYDALNENERRGIDRAITDRKWQLQHGKES